MCSLDPQVRLLANNNGETKCVVFVDSLIEARKSLQRFSSSIVAAYPFISAFGAHINAHQLDDLMSIPCVKAIASHSTVTTTLMRPIEKLPSVLPLYTDGMYGEGVNVAVIDTGVYPHADLTMPSNRLKFNDFVDGVLQPYDDNGHGTAVSSIICGNGLISNRKFCGVAPKANIIALKAIGSKGEGGAFHILEAMQWIYNNKDKLDIKIVCMSFGAEPVINAPDPLSIGASALWQSGITVITSAGNDGPQNNSIKSPGICPDVITVGGAGFNEEGAIHIPDFSSRGAIGGLTKPDIVAPAVDIACCAVKKNYTTFSGTSMAAPIVAGCAALLLSKTPSLKPARIKELLLDGAIPLPFEANMCGKGLVSLDFLYNEN